jgi:hypothetical protein
MRISHRLWLISPGRDKARLIQPEEGSGHVRESLHWDTCREEPMSKMESEDRYKSELMPLSRYQCRDTLGAEGSLKYVSYMHPCIPTAFSFTLCFLGWVFVTHSNANNTIKTPEQNNKPSSPT